MPFVSPLDVPLIRTLTRKKKPVKATGTSGLDEPFLPSARSPTEDLTDEDEDEDEKLSNSELLVTLSNALIGAASLGLPYVFVQGGLIFSILVVLFVALAMTITAIIIIRTADRMKGEGYDQFEFSDIGEYAFGPRGRTIINAALCVELWLTLVNQIGFLGVNAAIVFGVPPATAIITSGFITLGLFFVPPRVIASCSIVAVGSMIAVSLMLMYTAVEVPVWAAQARPDLVPLWKPEGVVAVLGMALMSFGGHPCIPSIYETAEEPKNFPRVTLGAFLLAGVYYVLVGVVGGFCFGNLVSQSFSENLGRDIAGVPLGKSALVLQIACSAGLCVKLQSVTVIFATPVLMALPGGSSMFARLIFVIFTTLAVLLVKDQIAFACAVTGLLATMTTSILFPIAVYMRVEEMHTCTRMCCGVFLVAAGAFALVGSAATIGGHGFVTFFSDVIRKLELSL
jgi:amino acid permease